MTIYYVTIGKKEYQVEINGKRVKGNILGEKIVAEAPVKESGRKGVATWLKVSLWILALSSVCYGVLRAARYFLPKKRLSNY